jgi:hypothetical protein
MTRAFSSHLGVTTIFTAIGAILFSQALSFGWYRPDSAEFSSHVQSICLFLAGIAFFALGLFVRTLLGKLSAMEDELTKLKARLGGE